jgi:hypothetical protein
MEFQMKEYHLFRVVEVTGYEQAYIASVIRDTHEKTIEIDEIFVITSVDGHNIKLRIDIEQLMEQIAVKPGGSIPVENLDKMFEELDEVIPPIEQLKNQIDLFQLECPDANSDILIMGAEAACSAHPTDFASVIQEKLDEQSPRTR